MNVLLVDDDEVDVITVKRAFATANITNRLFIARDGTEGLALLRGVTIPRQRRVVLLDLNMPRMNGLEFLRALRSDPELKATTVVVMTTSKEDRDRVEAFQLNVAGYVVKPVTFRAFTEAVAMLNMYWEHTELP